MWDLDTLKCLQTLHGHSDVVMSLLCWENVLLSGSLDGQIKVWAANESGSLEVVHESDEGHVSDLKSLSTKLYNEICVCLPARALSQSKYPSYKLYGLTILWCNYAGYSWILWDN